MSEKRIMRSESAAVQEGHQRPRQGADGLSPRPQPAEEIARSAADVTEEVKDSLGEGAVAFDLPGRMRASASPL
jgi:hypothetical protein